MPFVKVSSSPKYIHARIAVTTGIVLVKILAFVTPRFFIEKVKKIKANEDAKIPSFNSGTKTSHEKGTVLKWLNSKIRKVGRKKMIPNVF